MNRTRPSLLAWLAVAALTMSAAGATGQTPRPKPKASTSGRSGTGATGSPAAKPPYDGPATLLFQVDMACRIWVDGTLAATAANGDIKPIKVSLGDHLVKVETTDGIASWQRAINVPRADQQIVATELAAKWKTANAARLAAAAEAKDVRDAKWLQAAVTGVFDYKALADTWFRETQSLEAGECKLTFARDMRIGDPDRTTLSSKAVWETERTTIDLSQLVIDQVQKPLLEHSEEDNSSPIYHVEISTSPGVTSIRHAVNRDQRTQYAEIYVAGEDRAKSVWATIRKMARDCR